MLPPFVAAFKVIALLPSSVSLITNCGPVSSRIVRAVPESYFPVLEVSGTHYEIGFKIGKEFSLQIESALGVLDNFYVQIEDKFSFGYNRFPKSHCKDLKACIKFYTIHSGNLNRVLKEIRDNGTYSNEVSDLYSR